MIRQLSTRLLLLTSLLFFSVLCFGQNDSLRFAVGFTTVIRQNPTISSSMIVELAEGTPLKLVEVTDRTWSKVKYDQLIGYTISSHLSKSFPDRKSSPTTDPSFSSPGVIYAWDEKLGCYYLNSKGQKIPIEDSKCEGIENPYRTPSSRPTVDQPASSQSNYSPNYTGPRGGTYHYTKSGKKSYYKRKN